MTSTLLVFILYFVGIIGITLYASVRMLRKSNGDFSNEYFVGGRRIGPLALAILVAAGVCSTGTFIGGPGLAGENGWGFTILFGFGQLIMTLFVLGIVGKKINIVSRRINAQSYLDIFYYRFAKYKPLTVLLLFALVVFLITAASAEFVGGSRVIQSMTGIPFTYSLIGFGVLIIAYTALGGLRGVTSVAMLQGIIMTAASIILIIAFLVHFGGITPLFEASASLNPAYTTPGGTAPLRSMVDLWFTYSIGALGLAWGVQGALSYGSTRTMKIGIVAGIVMVTFWTIFMSLAGVAGKLLFPNLASSDLIIPSLVDAVLPGSLAGFVLAAVAGAGQSTIGALFILASGSVVATGFKLVLKNEPSPRTVRNSSIIVTIAVGVVVILLALNPPETLQNFITLSQGGSASALAPALILGLYWPRFNKYGATAGVLVGFCSYFLISMVDLPWGWANEFPMLISSGLSLLAGSLVSKLTNPPEKEILEAFFGSTPSSGEWLARQAVDGRPTLYEGSKNREGDEYVTD